MEKSKLFKNVSLNIKQKAEIINEYTKGEKTKDELLKEFKCSKSTLNRIIKNKNEILIRANQWRFERKRNRSGACDKVDKAVGIWYDQMIKDGNIISRKLILEKAKEFAIEMGIDFKPNSGWMWRWQRRQDIILKKRNINRKIDKTYVDTNCSITLSKDNLSNILTQYDPSNIFNATESGLFYKTLPLTIPLRQDQIKTNINSKEHLTILFLTNATGDYKKLVVIGKYKNPSSFKNINILPIDYYFNKNALMTTEIWQNIIDSLEEEFKLLDRKILLIVNNVNCHKTTKILQYINLQFLPKNSQLFKEPLDQGILSHFKIFYRKSLRRKQLKAIEMGKSIEEFLSSFYLLEAIHLIKYCWWLIKPHTIQNSFKKAGFLTKLDDTFQEDDEEILENNFEKYILIDEDLMCYEEEMDESDIKTILINCKNEYVDQRIHSNDEEYQQDNNENNKIPSVKMVLNSIDNLRKFFISDNLFLQDIENMENFIVTKYLQKSVQKKITDFFQKQ